MNEKQFLKMFGKRIKELREKENLTQLNLAEKVGFSPNFIGMIERGERNTKVFNSYKIANALNCSLEELFKGI